MNVPEQLILQRKLAQFLVSDVFNTITEDDILVQTKEGWKHKDILLTEGQIKLLKKDAEALSKSNFYKVLIDELNWHARSRLERSQTEQDMIGAKLLSYFVDVLRSKVKKIVEL